MRDSFDKDTYTIIKSINGYESLFYAKKSRMSACKLIMQNQVEHA